MRTMATSGPTAVKQLAAVWICGLTLLATTAAVRAERPMWQALPEETVAVVRLPAPREFYEALRSRTKLGAVAFEPRRIDAVKELLVADAKEDLEAVGARFKKLGLEPEDLLPLADGELGIAALLLPRDDSNPTPAFAAWSECGEAAAEKYLAALERSADEEAKDGYPLKREDVEIAGLNVRHFMLPKYVEEGREAKFGLGLKNGELNGDFDVKQREGDAEKQNTINGYQHFLACRGGGTLILLMTIPQSAEGDKPDAAAVEEQSRRGGEEARGTLARIVEQRAGGGESAVERWLQTPGLSAALPDGVPLVEAEVNLNGLAASYDRPETADAAKLMRALGLSDVGPAAYRLALDGTTLRSGLFVSAPQPRRGLIALLDQAPLPPQPADWVAGDVVGYQHLSFDLGKAYKQIAAIVAENSPKAKESLAQIEAQSQQFLQASVEQVLSAFGTKHIVVSFLPEEVRNAADPAHDAVTQNAMAFVWRVTDEALWRRLLGTAALVSGQPAKKEQGFDGLRHDTPEFSGGWFLGDGYMVLCFGKGVTERTLAMLRKPPQTADSLAGGALARRAAELVPPQNGLTYEITNGPTALRFLNDAVTKMFAESGDPDMVKLKAVWPSDEELEGVVGVSASVSHVDGHGLTYTSVSDLPAP